MSNSTDSLLRYAKLESDRFNLNVFRGEMKTVAPGTILDFLAKNEADIAIIRFPASAHADIVRLADMGIPYLIADILVYYHVDLLTYNPKALRNKDLQFVPFHDRHREVMDEMVKIIFSDYKNHYSSNPVLKADLVIAYQEWAGSLTTDEKNGTYSWLIKREGKDIGFATCRFDNKESEGILYGILPEESGKGLYGDLIRFTQRFSKERGCSTMKVSTQIDNYAVQKVWSREGFFLNQSFLTIHINSLFRASQSNKKNCTVQVNPENLNSAEPDKQTEVFIK